MYLARKNSWEIKEEYDELRIVHEYFVCYKKMSVSKEGIIPI